MSILAILALILAGWILLWVLIIAAWTVYRMRQDAQRRRDAAGGSAGTTST